VHARGILHRDIKPANLLRTTDGRVKLADFGLACRLTSAASAGPGGAACGSPHYMSPEQCRGEHCDERTDIYALGATYFALLTGQTPYADSDLVRILFEHCSAPVPDPHLLHQPVPRACADVCVRAMAKKRAERFASAGALRRALGALLRRSRIWPF
jgi:serine/threonine protein kinase